MSEQKEVKVSQYWIGFTKEGFARWLAPKHPDMDKCPFAFISEGDEKCEDVKVFIPKSDYDSQSQLLKEKDDALWNLRNAMVNVHNTLLDYYSEPDVYWDNPNLAFKKSQEALEQLKQNQALAKGDGDE